MQSTRIENRGNEVPTWALPRHSSFTHDSGGSELILNARLNRIRVYPAPPPPYRANYAVGFFPRREASSRVDGSKMLVRLASKGEWIHTTAPTVAHGVSLARPAIGQSILRRIPRNASTCASSTPLSLPLTATSRGPRRRKHQWPRNATDLQDKARRDVTRRDAT